MKPALGAGKADVRMSTLRSGHSAFEASLAMKALSEVVASSPNQVAAGAAPAARLIRMLLGTLGSKCELSI